MDLVSAVKPGELTLCRLAGLSSFRGILIVFSVAGIDVSGVALKINAGMAQDIPPNETEAVLLAHLAAIKHALCELAVQRCVAVRDYLIAQKWPSDRLFLGAAIAVSAGAKWSPRAELNLGTRLSFCQTGKLRRK